MISRLFYSKCDGDNCVHLSAAGRQYLHHGPKAQRWKRKGVANESCVLLAETRPSHDIWHHLSSLVACLCYALKPGFGDVFTAIAKDFRQVQLAD